MLLHGLTENHERSLLASVQYAARLIRDCDGVLATSDGSDVLSRYTSALSAPQQKIAHDYLHRLQEQLLRALETVGLQLPSPSIGAVHALSTALMFLDDTFEEMRGRYLRGYGEVSPEADRVLDGVVSEMQELVRDFEVFLTGVSDDVLRGRLNRLPQTHPVADELRELSRIVAEHGLVDLRPALTMLVDRALEDTFEVGVIGRVSSGKSSLLNALIGTPVLPTGVLPVTAFPTRLRRGPSPLLQVAYANGRTETGAVDRIDEFVTETSNPGNEKRLTRLLLVYPSDRVPEDVTFVDTPGLGSVASGGALQTFAYLPRCDHATFLFDATAPVAEEDLTVLVFLHDAGITMSVLLSKADLLGAGDLEQVRAYVAAQIFRRLGINVAVRPISTMPGNESLLRAWIEDEVTSLGARARRHAQDALVRKTGVLRAQAIAALERRTSGPRSVRVPGNAELVATRLREMSACLERHGRELLSLQDHRTEIVEIAIAAASNSYASAAGNPPPTDNAIRAALMRPSQSLAESVAHDLEEHAREVRSVLTDAAAASGVPALVLEPLELQREVPMVDLPPVSMELKPPLWARASQFLMRRWIVDRVRERWEPVMDLAVAAHLDVLRRWAMDGLARLRREFESHSRPLLTHLAPSGASVVPDGPATAALERDLTWLRQERMEVTPWR
jgi:GTP-binding protein EngB required for normal cell division